MSEAEIKKPVPLMQRMTKEFYDHCKNGELHFQRCTGCGRWRHVPREMCSSCGSWDWEWARSSGKGQVFTWTVVRRAMHPAFPQDVPYAPVVIEMEEGVRLVSWLVDVPVDEIEHKMPVEVVFEKVNDEVTLPKFKKADA